MARGTVTKVIIDYTPRPLQFEVHQAIQPIGPHRFGVLVCHRRFGKSVLGVNHLQRAALECKRPRPRFAYIGPTYTQAKSTIWDFLKFYARPIPGVKFNESELRVDYPNDGQVRIYGGDNPDSLRGLYFDGVVVDEYGLHQSELFSTVLRPALSDREGWALFLGTPNGKNQFYDLIYGTKEWQGAKADPTWFYASYPASQTGVIPQSELAAARKDMTADEYAQEYECSFEAAVKGAIYSTELEAARTSGRVHVVPYDPVLPVDTDWDLGVGDSTAIWFSQSLRSGEIRLIDYYEASGEGLPHYAQILRQKGYVYGQHWAPHDIAVRELGSGRSRIETAATLGIRFNQCPNIPIEDGIHAARMLFPKCWFDAVKCKAGLEALQHYKRDYNTRLNEFKATPVHDWCVTGDTKVLTRSGTYQIQYLPESGEVLTPCGWKAYENPRITRRNAPLVAVTFSDGLTVRCTPDHKFLTDSGWTFAADLRTGSQIRSCSTRSLSTLMAAFIASGRMSDISLWLAVGSIALFGSEPLVPFLTVATFIIGMAILETIASLIWKVSRPSFIYLNQVGSVWHLFSRPHHGRSVWSGINPMSDVFGTAETANDKRAGLSGSVKKNRARIAAVLFKCWCVGLETLRNIALIPARRLRIANVTALTGKADVWCLTVPEWHCWTLENGAVVHNSEHGASAFRYLAVRQQTPKDRPKPMPIPPAVRGPQAWMG